MYAKRCHVTKTHSSITNKQAVLKWERKQSLSCIKVRVWAPESMMEDLPFFCGWGWDIRLVVFGEGFWGCSRCNSAMDFFWVVKLPRLHHAQLWRVFSFKYRSMALCMILRDSSPWVSVSFCDLGLELYTQDLVKSLTPPFFLRRSFIHCFVELMVCLFTAPELRSSIASFETTKNLETCTCTFLRWLWICCCVVFVSLCFTGLDSSRCRRKKNSSKWTRNVGNFF